MPGRHFPGCVFQGDSLSILCGLARSISGRIAALGDDDLSSDAAELLDYWKTALYTTRKF